MTYFHSTYLYIFRQSGLTEYYATGNVLSYLSQFSGYFNVNSVRQTYKILVKGGIYMTTSKRKIAMYLYGSTIMGTQFPLFFYKGSWHPLPRPYLLSKPSNYGYLLLKRYWMIALSQEVEGLTLHFLQDCYPKRDVATFILEQVKQSKTLVPKSCRICDTFFTHVTVLGRFEDKIFDIPVHVDKKDIITGIVHFGEVSQGGLTQYYDGPSENVYGNVCESIPFVHGRIQIGIYNQVPHGVSEWRGRRGTINFNLKEDVLNHFRTFGNRFYQPYENSCYPEGPYCSF